MTIPTLILDGEIAIFDQKLVSRFEWLRRRAPAEIATPVLLDLRPLYRLAFDDVVCDLLKARAAAVTETPPRPVARPIRPRASPQPRSRRATSRPVNRSR